MVIGKSADVDISSHLTQIRNCSKSNEEQCTKNKVEYCYSGPVTCIAPVAKSVA